MPKIYLCPIYYKLTIMNKNTLSCVDCGTQNCKFKDRTYSDAYVTTLVTKDRVTGHNPAAALYTSHSYYKKGFGL